MKINIVFKRPPFEMLNDTNINNSIKTIVIKDPYTITMIGSERKIVGLDGSTITYEKYWIELQKVINDTLYEQKLEEIDTCDALTIEDCKEPPNFAALHAALVQTKIPVSSKCSITFSNCSFGGSLYVNSIISFINSVKKRKPDIFFYIKLHEDQCNSILTEHDKAKLASLNNVIFFPDAQSSAALRKFCDDQLLRTTKKIPDQADELHDSNDNNVGIGIKPSQLLNPNYFFRPILSQKPSPSTILLNFFSQAHQQQNDYTCGPAALQMIADYYTSLCKRTFCGQPVTNQPVWQNLNAMMELRLAEQIKTTEEVGTEIDDMRNELIKLGLQVIDDSEGLNSDKHDELFLKAHKELLWDRFKEIFKLGIPIIINMRDRDEIGHYEVAIGMDDQENIIFSEPGSALAGVIDFETIPRAKFIERWRNMSGKQHGRFLIIPPNEASAKSIVTVLKDLSYCYNGVTKGKDQQENQTLKYLV